MEISKNLQTFEELSIVFTKESGNERIAQCPFCGKKDHFYVNNETTAFNCKRCGQSGAKSKFIQLIYEDHLVSTTDAQLLLYSVEKSIPLQTLKQWGIAYDKTKHRFLFPYWGIDGKFCDIRFAKLGEKPKSLKGVEIGLFGCSTLLNKNTSNKRVKIKSNAPRKNAAKRDIDITTKVSLIVSCRLGQFTLNNSCFDSCKNELNFANIFILYILF